VLRSVAAGDAAQFVIQLDAAPAQTALELSVQKKSATETASARVALQ